MSSLKEKTANGLLWGGIASGLQQLLNLVFGICLGRLLTAADYGMVGYLTVFTLIAGSLQEGGFISALNKRKNVTRADYNSVFWFNTLMSLSLYTLLFFCAPLIADFFHEPDLTTLARYVFAGFVISSLNIVPRAYLFRELKVKQNTIISFVALLTSGIVGVTMAWQGFAYWGIATQSIVYAVCTTLGTYWVTRWWPSIHFSFRPVREMLGYSGRLIITNIFVILNQQLFSILLGKLFNRRELGKFTQANKWNTMGHSLISQMLYSVTQPLFAKVDDRKQQRAALQKMVRLTACLTFPAMFGLSIIAHEFIIITITEKWLASAAMLQLLCIWGAFVPMQTLFQNFLLARGHSGIYMWGTIGLAILVFGAALLVSPYGLEWMLRVFVAVNILWLLFWHHFVRCLTGYGLLAFLKDMAPYLGLSVVLCIGAYFLFSSVTHLWLSLLGKVLFVGTTYCLTLWLSGSAIFRESLLFLFKKGKAS